MAVKIQINKYDSLKQLCRSCKYGSIKRGYGFVCKFTAESPSYYGHCPYFKIFRYRDDKIHKASYEFQQQVLNIVLGFLFFIGFVLANYFMPFEESILILMILLFAYAIYYANKPMIVNRFGWFPYIYLILAGFAAKNKESYSEDELRIIQTQVIKIMGWTAIKQANIVLKNESDSIEKIEKYISKLTVEDTIIAFSLVCEVYVYKNLDDFLTSETLKKIAFLLNLNTEDYLRIKKKYELREINYHRKKAEAKQKKKFEKEYREKHKSYRIFSINRIDYYSVLGLQNNASISEIKSRFRELAVLYHPDKHKPNSEEQKNASKKFKEFSEAYNYLRKQKGF